MICIIPLKRFATQFIDFYQKINFSVSIYLLSLVTTTLSLCVCVRPFWFRLNRNVTMINKKMHLLLVFEYAWYDMHTDCIHFVKIMWHILCCQAHWLDSFSTLKNTSLESPTTPDEWNDFCIFVIFRSCRIT